MESQNNELYLKIFEEFPALIWRSGLDKLCDYFNHTWLEFTGRTLEQELGNGWAEGVHPDDLDFCINIYVEAFDRREPFMMEYRLKNKFGEYRWIRDYGRPFFDLDNKFIGYIGSCYDITINKHNEEKIIEANAAKDKLLSIIAHDLRGPFTGFIGLAEGMVTDIDNLSKKEIVAYSSAIYKTATRLLGLLNNLLEWAKLESGKIQFNSSEINLYEEVENIRSLFSSAIADKSLDLINKLNPGSTIFTDNNILSTVLRNLISNAVKFTPKGGSIIISSKAEGDFVNISVCDSGIGMAEEAISKLFRIGSGYTTKGTDGEVGTGLGLILCKEMVEKNGGRFIVSSVPGQGTEFTFTLPASHN